MDDPLIWISEKAALNQGIIHITPSVPYILGENDSRSMGAMLQE